MFTYHYNQPDEYHFSLDSIHFSEFVVSQLQSRTDLASLRMLDLCSGCGVIGLEISWYLRNLKKIDFVEIQEVYTDYFYKNVSAVNRPELELNLHILNYDELLNHKWNNTFDIIVSNPPYFQPSQGMLSPSAFKNRCRFYLDSSFENFILAMANALKVGGKAYFLLRPLKQHGQDVFHQIQQILKNKNITSEKITTLRGTDVICMEKLIKLD